MDNYNDADKYKDMDRDADGNRDKYNNADNNKYTGSVYSRTRGNAIIIWRKRAVGSNNRI